MSDDTRGLLLVSCLVACGPPLTDASFGVTKTNPADDASNPDAPPTAPNLVAGPLASLATSPGGFTCVIRQGRLKCWGENGSGQLGLGDQESRGADLTTMGDALPNVVLGAGRSAAGVALGQAHTCVLLDNGQPTCWGANSAGALGYGDLLSRGFDMGDRLNAVDLGTGRWALSLSSAEWHTYAVLDTHQVKCWGNNSCISWAWATTTRAAIAPTKWATPCRRWTWAPTARRWRSAPGGTSPVRFWTRTKSGVGAGVAPMSRCPW